MRCLRPKVRENSGHFKFAIERLQTNRKLTHSLQNSFGPIPKCQENFNTLDFRLHIGRLRPKVRESSGHSYVRDLKLANESQAFP